MATVNFYPGGGRAALGGKTNRIPYITTKPGQLNTAASARYNFGAEMIEALMDKREADKEKGIRSDMLAAMLGDKYQHDPNKASESFTPSEYIESQRVALADAQAQAQPEGVSALGLGSDSTALAPSLQSMPLTDFEPESLQALMAQAPSSGISSEALEPPFKSTDFTLQPNLGDAGAMQAALIGDVETPEQELAAYAGSPEEMAAQESAYKATVNTPDAVAARMAEAVRLNPDIANDRAYQEWAMSHLAQQQKLRAESTARDRAADLLVDTREHELNLKRTAPPAAPKEATRTWKKIKIRNADGTQQLVWQELNSGDIAKNRDGTYATAPPAEGVSSEVNRELQDIRRTYLAGNPALFNMKVNEEVKTQEKLTGRKANVEGIKRNLLELYGLASPSYAASDVNVNPVPPPATSAPVSAVAPAPAPAESWLSPAEEGDFAFVKTGTDEAGNPVYGIQASDSVFDIADQEKAGQRTQRQTAATSQINRQAGVFDDRPANYLEGRTRREVLRSEMQRKSTDRQAIKQEGGFRDAYGTQVENILSENIVHNEKIDYWAKGLQTNYFGARGALDAIDSILAFDGKVAPLEPLTGTLAPAMAMIKESPAGQISSHMDTLKSQVVLQSMMMLKAASSTGSTGFGQLNQKELQTLIDSLGKLEMSTDWDITKKTLNRAKKFFEQRLSFTDGIIESDADAEALGVVGIWKDMEENRERFEAESLQIRPDIDALYEEYVPR